MRVYVNQNSVGEYQCIAWFGASALASIPAKLTLAAIQLNSSKSLGTQVLPVAHWKVQPGNSILVKCGDVISNPPPVWTFFK